MASRPASAFNGLWWNLVLLPMLLGLLLAGCSSRAALPSPKYDGELSGAIVKVSDECQTVRLADLTDFDWDTVYVFRPYFDGESINRTVGQDVVRSSYRHVNDGENVLIFVRDGSLAHAAEVQRVGIEMGSERSFIEASSGAWLAPYNPDRDCSLRLVEQLPDD